MAVTISDVRKVYKGDISDDDLTYALDTAKLVVTEQLGSCQKLSADRKDRITVYLAAHFAELTGYSADGVGGPLRRSKLGEADDSYAVPLVEGVGYKSTKWGQLAVALDLCNILINATMLPAQFRVI